MKTSYHKIILCIGFILISSFSFYFFLKSAIVSSTELAALNNHEGLTAAEYLNLHGNDRFAFGFTYNNSKRLDDDEGILNLTICLNHGIAVESLDFKDPVNSTIRSIEHRFDRAGMPIEIIPVDSGLYKLYITHVIDSASVRCLLTTNITMGVWETINADRYLDFTDTVSPLNESLLHTFTLYRDSEMQGAWGYSAISDTAKTIQLLLEKLKGDLSENVTFLWGKNTFNENTLDLYGLHHERNGGPALLISNFLEDIMVKTSRDQSNGSSLYLTLNTEGAHFLAGITRKNCEQAIAVTLNKEVIVAPFVEAEVSTGKMELQTNFTYTESQLIRTMLLSGDLNVSVQIIDVQYSSLFFNEETSMAGFKRSKNMLFFFGTIIITCFALCLYLVYKKYWANLLHNKNSNKLYKRNNGLFLLLCTVFSIFSFAMLIRAASSWPFKIAGIIQAFTLLCITIGFIQKKATGWAFMVSYWLFSVAFAIGITIYAGAEALMIHDLLILTGLSALVIASLFTTRIRKITFKIETQKNVIIRQISIYIIFLAIILWLVPKLLSLLF